METIDTAQSSPTYTAFFYGTLMHPDILRKIIDNDGLHLEIAPATLHYYIRHQVQGASFPAIISYEQSKLFLKTDIPEERCCVNGIVARGLSLHDMHHIGSFEGNYYKLVSTYVQPGRDFISMKNVLEGTFLDDLKTFQETAVLKGSTAPVLRVLTYIWDYPIKDLSPELWSFDTFLKEKLKMWL